MSNTKDAKDAANAIIQTFPEYQIIIDKKTNCNVKTRIPTGIQTGKGSFFSKPDQMVVDAFDAIIEKNKLCKLDENVMLKIIAHLHFNIKDIGALYNVSKGVRNLITKDKLKPEFHEIINYYFSAGYKYLQTQKNEQNSAVSFEISKRNWGQITPIKSTDSFDIVYNNNVIISKIVFIRCSMGPHGINLLINMLPTNDVFQMHKNFTNLIDIFNNLTTKEPVVINNEERSITIPFNNKNLIIRLNEFNLNYLDISYSIEGVENITTTDPLCTEFIKFVNNIHSKLFFNLDLNDGFKINSDSRRLYTKSFKQNSVYSKIQFQLLNTYQLTETDFEDLKNDNTIFNQVVEEHKEEEKVQKKLEKYSFITRDFIFSNSQTAKILNSIDDNNARQISRILEKINAFIKNTTIPAKNKSELLINIDNYFENSPFIFDSFITNVNTWIAPQPPPQPLSDGASDSDDDDNPNGGALKKKHKKKKVEKTDQSVTYKGRKYLIYTGPRSGKYIRRKGKFISLKSIS